MSVNEDFEQTIALLLAQVPAVLGVEEGARCTEQWPEPNDGISGTIGFGGEDLRGSLVLVASPEVWKRIAPDMVPSSEASMSLLCDMVAEVCNMVVGRFRTQLLRRGVELGCGTPTSNVGNPALSQLPRTTALHVANYRFESAAGCIYLRTDLLFGDHFVYPSGVPSGPEPPDFDLFSSE